MDMVKGLDTTEDVLHSIEAVGSRDKKKAQEFIEKYCPDGAIAQKRGVVSRKPQACGSYEEVINHSVSRRWCDCSVDD